MNGINWTHLLTLTLSPEKGSNELKTDGALNEALPMGIIAYGPHLNYYNYVAQNIICLCEIRLQP